MKRLLLSLALLTAPACAKESPAVTPSHLHALQALGLPLYLVPNDSQLVYRGSSMIWSENARGYDLEYWETSGESALALHFAFSTAMPKEQPRKGLETRRGVAGGLGKLTVTRFQGSCRTDWTACSGGFFKVEADEALPLDRFVQLVEGFHRTNPLPARATAHQEALKVANLPEIRLGNLKPILEEIEFDGARGFHHDRKEYRIPGIPSNFQLYVSSGGGDRGLAFRHPLMAERRVNVPTVGNIVAAQGIYRDSKDGSNACYTEDAQVGKANLHAICKGIAFPRFLELISRLRY